jgi:ABC-type transport system involved in cytochrome c biogenesis permease subunit
MRILWQLTQGGVASAALMAGCWIVFGKRSGIVLLHSGIGLMMFYELHVALTAVETQMNLEEGETTAFVHDIRTFELAVIDTSKPGEQRVTAIPRSMVKSMVKAGESIDLPDLPFRIKIRDVLDNSHLRAASSQDDNPATAGLGVEWFAEPKKPGTGTDMDSKVDMAAAYITLTDRTSDKPIGTYLLSMLLSMSNEADQVRIGDRTFELALRPKRYYKPFTFRLKDVRKEDYLGTTTPRNYASTVFIEEPAQNVHEEKTIWMNNPLRFSNETFYQSGYFQERGTGIEHTTLSVVANSGWMMPYVACMLVAIGMLVHFMILLVRFLMRGDTVRPNAAAARLAERLGIKPAAKPSLAGNPSLAATSVGIPEGKQFDWQSVAAAATVVLVAGAYIIGRAIPPSSNAFDYDLYRFGQIPVVQEGRVKPLDSAAYTALLEISGRTYVQIGHGKDKREIPAIQWLLDVISGIDVANDYEVFRVENLEVQETIGVKKREGMRYSRNEIRKHEKEFREQVALARQAASKDSKSMSIYQRKVIELDTKLSTYDSLMFAFGLHRMVENAPDSEKLRTFQMGVQFEPMLAKQGQPVFAVAPQDKDHEWQTLSGAWIEDLIGHVREKKTESPAVAAWKEILSTYADSKQGSGEKKKRPQDFNRSVADYEKLLEDHPPHDVNLFATRFEAFFNHLRPFTHADRLYILAFVLGAFGWLGWTQGFNRMAFWLLVSIFVLHSLALGARIYISGRPPVTNLYSSAVFIGWGCVALGLVLELVFRLGIGNLIAAVAGYATLLIADGLSLKGDTFTVLQAVLDTQFWLATHVTTITLGYATTYLAGLLGVVYVLRGVFTPSLTPEIRKDLSRMIYGTLCFSIFFSFVGTVLGGLWADDSWGRFWGWDPKENGALIIVLWNALVLHARWGGMVKERGMAVLAIAGNIFVSWSWWGVNELGAGLHAYGFTEGTVVKLALFVLSQLVLIGIGLTPRQFWGSHQERAEV